MADRPVTDLRKGSDIAERLLDLAAALVVVIRQLARDPVSRHIAGQLIRCGTSAGANYEEARAAESRADFVHKVRIASKELRETLFWLRLAHRTCFDERHRELERLIGESRELLAILHKSAETARANDRD